MDVVASGDQIHVALVVVLKGGTIAVIGPAIGFNDDLLSGPEEVNEMSFDQNVDRRG